VAAVASLVITILFGQEVYKRQNPNVSQSSDLLTNSRIYYHQFPAMFSFHYPNEMGFRDWEKYLTVDIVQGSFGVEGPLYNRNNSLVPCKDGRLEHFSTNSSLLHSYMDIVHLDHRCLNFTQDNYIQNGFGTSNGNFFMIQIKFCDPETSEKECWTKSKPLQLIPLIRSLFVGVTYVNTYVDSLNEKNPIAYYSNTAIFDISHSLSKMVYFALTKNVIISDNGWLLEYVKEYDYIRLDENFKVEVSSKEKEDKIGYLLTLVWESPQVRTKTKRNYMKVQELFARVGGITNFFLLSIQVLSMSFLRFSYLFHIREQTFGKIPSSSDDLSNNDLSSSQIKLNLKQNQLNLQKEIKRSPKSDNSEGKKEYEKQKDPQVLLENVNKEHILEELRGGVGFRFKTDDMLHDKEGIVYDKLVEDNINVNIRIQKHDHTNSQVNNFLENNLASMNPPQNKTLKKILSKQATPQKLEEKGINQSPQKIILDRKESSEENCEEKENKKESSKEKEGKERKEGRNLITNKVNNSEIRLTKTMLKNLSLQNPHSLFLDSSDTIEDKSDISYFAYLRVLLCPCLGMTKRVMKMKNEILRMEKFLDIGMLHLLLLESYSSKVN